VNLINACDFHENCYGEQFCQECFIYGWCCWECKKPFKYEDCEDDGPAEDGICWSCFEKKKEQRIQFEKMSYGYLYCFSNESMPGIVKVGMTKQTPEITLNEANSFVTWRPPTTYKLEFAKKVLNPKKKETALHSLLSLYAERINPEREFFRVSTEKVKEFFDLIDGDWVKDHEEDSENRICLCLSCGGIIRNRIIDNNTIN